IDARTADLEKGDYAVAAERWDLIVMSLYFQRDLFEPAKQGVVPGGIVAVVALMMEPGKENSPFRVQPGELRGFFQGWDILHDREGAAASPHVTAEIIARRPR